jgi:hypothetical protein
MDIAFKTKLYFVTLHYFIKIKYSKVILTQTESPYYLKKCF